MMGDVLMVIAAWQRGDLKSCHVALLAWCDRAGPRFLSEVLAARLPRDLLAAFIETKMRAARVAVIQIGPAQIPAEN